MNHEPTPDDVEALDWRPVWVEDFIAYCHTNQVPLDFIATHPYPQDFPLDDLVTGRTVRMKRGVDATLHDLRLLRQIVDNSPFPKAEIQLTEWSSSPSSRDFTHDCLPAAAFLVKANIESAGLVDSLSYWTFTDVFEEKGAGDTIFHGGFGLVNYQGIVKPAFHAYRFLNALGDEVIARTNGVIVTRKKSTGKLTALIYNYPSEVKISLPTSGSLAGALNMLDKRQPDFGERHASRIARERDGVGGNARPVSRQCHCRVAADGIARTADARASRSTPAGCRRNAAGNISR